MKLRSPTFLLMLTCALGISTAQAGDLPTVNGKPIKQSLYDFVVKESTTQGKKPDESGKAAIVGQLVDQELLVQEAQKAGLDKQADYLTRIELNNRVLLSQTYLQDYVKKNPIDEATLRAEYDKVKQEMGDKEYSLRHILVKTEQEAKDIIAQLAKGADFAKLAKEKSLDQGSKDHGGELGWVPVGRMLKPFTDAVSGMQKGEVTKTPVQTQFGWHVVKFVDVRELQFPPYEKLKDNIQAELQKHQLAKLMADLRAKAKIVEASAKAK